VEVHEPMELSFGMLSRVSPAGIRVLGGGRRAPNARGGLAGLASPFPPIFFTQTKGPRQMPIWSQTRLVLPLTRTIGRIADSDDVCTPTEGALLPNESVNNSDADQIAVVVSLQYLKYLYSRCQLGRMCPLKREQ